MEVKPNITYAVSLNAAEFKLVTRALAGLIKGGTKEDGEALALNEQLLANRAAYLANLKQVADGTLDTARKFRAEAAGPRGGEEASGDRPDRGPDQPGGAG